MEIYLSQWTKMVAGNPSIFWLLSLRPWIKKYFEWELCYESQLPLVCNPPKNVVYPNGSISLTSNVYQPIKHLHDSRGQTPCLNSLGPIYFFLGLAGPRPQRPFSGRKGSRSEKRVKKKRNSPFPALVTPSLLLDPHRLLIATPRADSFNLLQFILFTFTRIGGANRSSCERWPPPVARWKSWPLDDHPD